MSRGSIVRGCVGLATLLSLGVAGCAGRSTTDAGRPRRDGGVDADLESVDALGLDVFIAPSEDDAGMLNVASCLGESLCDEFHDYPAMLLAEEEAQCVAPNTWSRLACALRPGVAVAGGCRVEFGDSHYYISWYRSPEFTPSDVRLICMTAGFPFVAAR